MTVQLSKSRVPLRWAGGGGGYLPQMLLQTVNMTSDLQRQQSSDLIIPLNSEMVRHL